MSRQDDAPGDGQWAATVRDWSTHGEQDPLWAVLVEPGTRGDRWDRQRFLDTGIADVDDLLGWVEGLAPRPERPVRTWTALDFGCGAGRLTQALAARVDTAVGVDVAPGMLATARELDTASACDFRLATGPVLPVDDASCDLVVSLLVLQHLPRPLGLSRFAEFARVLRPGGLAVLEFPTGRRLTPQGVASAVLPHPVVARLQTGVLGYPAPMRMTVYRPRALADTWRRAGLREVARTELTGDYADRRSPHWRMTRVLLERPAD